jgi:hypothetical protein
MSRLNKVNKGRYMQAGRLTPDELARERERQRQPTSHPAGGRIKNRADDRRPRPRGESASNRRRSGREE